MTFSKTLLRVAGWLFALSAPLSLPAYDLALEEIASGFVEPAQVTGARDGGGRVFVVELGGTVRIVWPDGSVDAEPFLDLRGRVDFLYSIAFHPDYASNGRFFVYERETVDDDVESYILEMRVDPANPDAADPTFERVVMMLQRGQPGVGGLVEFGPDGMLYVGVGDNEVSANGQDRSNVLGKILRIDIDSAIPYAIPPDNPLIDEDPQTRDEIWAYGLRNPWRFSIDAETGLFYCGDVGSHGAEAREEINIVPAGGNCGWAITEGFECHPEFPDCNPAEYVAPTLAYPRSEGSSVIGGFVYRGQRFPAMRGVYFFGDWSNGKIYSMKEIQPRVFALATELQIQQGATSSMGLDDDGEILAVDYFNGVLYRLIDATPRASGLLAR